MKTLELENLGLVELDTQQSEEVNGGWIWLAGVAAGLVISAIDHWPDIKNGFRDALADY